MVDESDFQFIRYKKALEYLKLIQSKKSSENTEEVRRKKEISLFLSLLTPKAQEYYRMLLKNKPKVADKIRRVIFTLISRGYMLYNLLTEIDIMRLERKIEGIEPQIYIQHKGDSAKTIADFLRSEKD